MVESNTSIEKSIVLRQAYIDCEHYTLSLLQEGSYAGLIDESGLTRIQTEIMSLLKETLIKYTHGESTSVKSEIAESILTSILYSVDAQLIALSPEDALNYLRINDVKRIYQKGLDLITSCFDETKILYRNIANNKLNVELYAYNSTIDEALPEFFAHYDPLYSAQKTWALMDYPLLYSDLKGSGIYFIKQYLENLAIEEHFCSLFDPEAVDNLLYNYGKVYRIDYRETLINILEILLTNSIFSVLSGNRALDLRITTHQYTLLQEKFKDLDNGLCTSIISKAINTLLEELHIDAPKICDYIKTYQALLMPRFFSALENGNLMNIIIISRDKDQPLDIRWDEGNKLNDEDFRLLVEQILECTAGTEKAAIINSSINSLGDFIDVLEADCLFDTEYTDLFTTLGDMELSILMRIVFAEELRVGGIGNLGTIIDEKQLEIPWQIEYSVFLNGLTPARIRAIEYFIPAALQTNKPSIY